MSKTYVVYEYGYTGSINVYAGTSLRHAFNRFCDVLLNSGGCLQVWDGGELVGEFYEADEILNLLGNDAVNTNHRVDYEEIDDLDRLSKSIKAIEDAFNHFKALYWEDDLVTLDRVNKALEKAIKVIENDQYNGQFYTLDVNVFTEELKKQSFGYARELLESWLDKARKLAEDLRKRRDQQQPKA